MEVPQIQSSTELNDNFEAKRVLFWRMLRHFSDSPESGARIFRALDDEEFSSSRAPLGGGVAGSLAYSVPFNSIQLYNSI